jgi:hypothetical protein
MKTSLLRPLRPSLLILTLGFVAGFAAERMLDTTFGGAPLVSERI